MSNWEDNYYEDNCCEDREHECDKTPCCCCPGPKGDKGDPGPMGPRGYDGCDGKKGDKGDKGDRGARGYDGCDGEKGEPGCKGDKGDKGERGDKGEPGCKGDKGDKGDKGEQGCDGDKGEPGCKGDKGDKGEPGCKGDKGDKGCDGEKGDRGPKGDKGDKGDRGEPGPKLKSDYIRIYASADIQNVLYRQGDTVQFDCIGDISGHAIKFFPHPTSGIVKLDGGKAYLAIFETAVDPMKDDGVVTLSMLVNDVIIRGSNVFANVTRHCGDGGAQSVTSSAIFVTPHDCEAEFKIVLNKSDQTRLLGSILNIISID